jgi:transcriptional regulator with XRE-family HTH domain
MEQHIRRYVEALSAFIQRKGMLQVDLEKRLGWSRGTLTKVLKGRQKLTVGHVLSLVEVLDIEPLSFYTEVHGGEKSRAEPTPAEALFRMLGSGGRPIVLSRFLTDEDLDQRISEAVAKALSRREKEL